MNAEGKHGGRRFCDLLSFTAVPVSNKKESANQRRANPMTIKILTRGQLVKVTNGIHIGRTGYIRRIYWTAFVRQDIGVEAKTVYEVRLPHTSVRRFTADSLRAA